MSSRPEVHRILVAGDEELGFSLCAKLLDRNLTDPRTLARESLESEWPEDEWIKLVSVIDEGVVTTYELDLELHGPWVWELYSTLEPRDYFRRFSGVVLCADPFRETLPSELSNLMSSVELHVRNYSRDKQQLLGRSQRNSQSQSCSSDSTPGRTSRRLSRV
ncbi:MAG: hypothetical protein ACW98U_07730 [Candidatus Thorarchaeota archaeon]